MALGFRWPVESEGRSRADTNIQSMPARTAVGACFEGTHIALPSRFAEACAVVAPAAAVHKYQRTVRAAKAMETIQTSLNSSRRGLGRDQRKSDSSTLNAMEHKRELKKTREDARRRVV